MSGKDSVNPAKGREEKPMSGLARSIRTRLLAREIKLVTGSGETPVGASGGSGGLTVLCLVRDGLPYVEEFVRHYRSLGAERLVFLDNGSTDGTLEALGTLAREGDITVLMSRLPYKEYKYLMKQYLYSRFGMNRWSLYVDIDEFFDYPYSGTLRVEDFLRYLTHSGYSAVTCHMLDMFPERLVAGEEAADDSGFRSGQRLYDLKHLGRARPGALREWNNEVSNAMVERFSGGIREILFGVRPNLTKYPLVFMDGAVTPAPDSSHQIRGAKVADISCVLYHYKFLQGFHDQARRAVREGNYYAGSKEYRKYLEVLDSGPELVLRQTTSKTLESTEDLIPENFIIVSEPYVALANRFSESEEASDRRTSHLDEQTVFARQIEERRRLAEKRRELREAREQMQKLRTIPQPSLESFPDDVLSDVSRPLFVGGCQRSGTTAFIEYMNDHPDVALCYERYKKLRRDEITPEKFAFDRILDYRPRETDKPWNLDLYLERHRAMLETKEESEILWVGDKKPNFISYMPLLLANNPGARFIMLYRPVEEVAESWQARAEDETDDWDSSGDFERGVEYWNRAMESLRDFTETADEDRLLIISYHDFFGSPESCIPLLEDFLSIELPESTLESWRRRSSDFDSNRRDKSPLTGEQTAYIEANANREAEAHVLKRIRLQGESRPARSSESSSGISSEAVMFTAMKRYGALLEASRERVSHQSSRIHDLELQLTQIRTSRSWRGVLALGEFKARLFAAAKRLRR